MKIILMVARLRRGVQERLSRRLVAGYESSSLDLADAQFLVARAHGFESWAQLAEYFKKA